MSDFSIILAILIFCGIDACLGLETPKLIVPIEFKVRTESIVGLQKVERVHEKDC